MRFWSIFITFLLVAAAASCGARQSATPLETFKTYTKAIKSKDTASMKLLLSDATIKMHEKEAKSLGITLDDVVKRQSLFGENQKSVEFRNEKVDGEKATLEVKNQVGNWETIPFVYESGSWKIDVAGAADKMTMDIENQQKQEFDRLRGVDPTTAFPSPQP